MKLITKEQLMGMPKGTLFCEWEPNVCGHLHFYEGNRGDCDLWQAQLAETSNPHKVAALERGESVDVHFEPCSAGIPDNTQMFLVWEESDIIYLIDKLNLINFPQI